MKCNYCDYEVKSDTVYCPNCGENIHTKKKNTIKDKVSSEDTEKSNDVNIKTNIEDTFIVFGILGFILPFMGLIIFLIWQRLYPKCAKAAGIGALIKIAFYILYFIFTVVINSIIS